MTTRRPRSANPVYRIVTVRTVQVSLAALAASWGLHWPLTGSHALGFFLTPALCIYFLFVFVARWSWGLPLLIRLPPQGRNAALTFDDGPSPETTPLVLDLLRERGVLATFFVLGASVDQNPDLLARIVREGHRVGIHAYHHRPFVLLTRCEIEQEIGLTREAIYRVCPDAKLAAWLRPPYGFKTPTLIWAAHRSRCRLAGWSVDSRDYRECSPDQITRHVLDSLHPGAIILLHDGPENTATVNALPRLLTEMAARGWEFARLPLDDETS